MMYCDLAAQHAKCSQTKRGVNFEVCVADTPTRVESMVAEDLGCDLALTPRDNRRS